MSDAPPPAPKPAEPPPAPPPAAPSVGVLLEQSLTALVDAPGVFLRLAARPAPSIGAALAAASVWGAAFFLINAARVGLSSPAAFARFSPVSFVFAGAAALATWAALALLGGAILLVLGRMLGKEGDFGRGMEAAAVVLAAAPVLALCGWAPGPAWMAPTVVAAWMAACALSAFFGAPPWGARAACAVVAAGALALQYGARAAADRLAAGAAAAPAALELAGQLEQFQEASRQAAAAGASAPAPAGAPASSLDLLRGTGGDDPVDDGTAAPALVPPLPRAAPDAAAVDRGLKAARDLNASMIAMLDSLGPMLSDPRVVAGLKPSQRADLAELKRLIGEAKTEMKADKFDRKANDARIMKIQALTMRLMEANIPLPGDSAPGGRK